MKIKVTLLSVFLLTFMSCTKDDNPSQNQETAILPKKIISIEGSDTYASTITYNGNKIAEITRTDGSKSVYTYTGDLITKVTSYEGTVISGTDDYNYENGKLKSNLNVEYSLNTATGTTTIYKLRAIYTHNSDGTILMERYSTDPITTIETKSSSAVYTFLNGNLTKEVSSFSHTYFNGTKNITTIFKNTFVFEYDGKNNPATNILGLNKIEFWDTSSLNNVIKRTTLSESTTNGVANSVSTPKVRNYDLSYNGNNFLTESKYTDTNINNIPTTFTEQYLYE